jgi:hypothetical protein
LINYARIVPARNDQVIDREVRSVVVRLIQLHARVVLQMTKCWIVMSSFSAAV